MATRDTVLSIAAMTMNRSEDDLTPVARFVDLGADELDVAELVMILEDELDINLDAPGYETVGELLEACEVEVRRKGGQAVTT